MEWISVKNRLPEEGSIVVTYSLDVALHCRNVAYFNGRKFIPTPSGVMSTHEDIATEFDAELYAIEVEYKSYPTHWMILPKPPKE